MDDSEDLRQRLYAVERELQAAQEAAMRHAKKAAELKEEVDALRRSTSWRVTAALRAPRVVSLWLQETWRRAQDQWGRADSVQTFLRAMRERQPYSDDEYRAWLAQHEQRPAALAPGDDEGPLISVILPVYNPPPELLKEAIASVKAQLYPHWELCIADDASTDPRIGDLLRTEAAADQRVRVVFRGRNGHISATSNSAIELARGDYLALLDHDDLLPVDALYWVADAIRREPDAAILYSDEDRVDAGGQQRYEPYFKPDYNYELLLAQNMISHLGVYRRDLVEAVGGFREGFEGSQDLDLALRIIERVAPGQVVHIPRILYHWRAIPGSTALENQEKGYASGAAIRAVQAHLERTGQAAEVVPCSDLHIFNAVRYRLPTDHAPGVSVILGGAAARTGADQFAAQFAGSDPGLTPELLPVADDHTLAHALETARLAAENDLLVFIISPLQTLGADVLRHLVTWAAQPRVGFVAPRVWSPDFRLDHGGVIFHAADGACYLNQDLRRGLYGRGGRAVLHQRLAALSPLMLACRREVLAEIGGLDTRFSGRLTLLDACLRADARGLHNVWLPDATVTLPRGVCRGKLDLFKDPALSPDDRAHWLEKWPEPPGAGDYHPALSPDVRFHLSERPMSPWI